MWDTPLLLWGVQMHGHPGFTISIFMNLEGLCADKRPAVDKSQKHKNMLSKNISAAQSEGGAMKKK